MILAVTLGFSHFLGSGLTSSLFWLTSDPPILSADLFEESKLDKVISDIQLGFSPFLRLGIASPLPWLTSDHPLLSADLYL